MRQRRALATRRMSFGLPRTPQQREAHELQNRERGKQDETTKRRSDEAMIRRFEAGLRERGIITNFAAASVATEIDGKPLVNLSPRCSTAHAPVDEVTQAHGHRGGHG
jgi:hypothetical protein